MLRQWLLQAIAPIHDVSTTSTTGINTDSSITGKSNNSFDHARMPAGSVAVHELPANIPAAADSSDSGYDNEQRTRRRLRSMGIISSPLISAIEKTALGITQNRHYVVATTRSSDYRPQGSGINSRPPAPYNNSRGGPPDDGSRRAEGNDGYRGPRKFCIDILLRDASVRVEGNDGYRPPVDRPPRDGPRRAEGNDGYRRPDQDKHWGFRRPLLSREESVRPREATPATPVAVTATHGILFPSCAAPGTPVTAVEGSHTRDASHIEKLTNENELLKSLIARQSSATPYLPPVHTDRADLEYARARSRAPLLSRDNYVYREPKRKRYEDTSLLSGTPLTDQFRGTPLTDQFWGSPGPRRSTLFGYYDDEEANIARRTRTSSLARRRNRTTRARRSYSTTSSP